MGFSDCVLSCTLSQHRDFAREVIINNPDIGDPNIWNFPEHQR